MECLGCKVKDGLSSIMKENFTKAYGLSQKTVLSKRSYWMRQNCSLELTPGELACSCVALQIVRALRSVNHNFKNKFIIYNLH